MIIKVTPKKFIIINKTKNYVIPRIVQFSVNKYIQRYIGVKQIKFPIDSNGTSILIDEATVTVFHNYSGSVRVFIISSITSEYTHTIILVKVSETPFWRFWYFVNANTEYKGYLTSEDLKSIGLPLHLTEEQQTEELEVE